MAVIIADGTAVTRVAVKILYTTVACDLAVPILIKALQHGKRGKKGKANKDWQR